MAASTHQGEETLCLKVHLNLKKKFKEVITIIAPRHIARVEKIRELCNYFKFSSQILNEKDIIVICDVGAYGMSLSSNYNLRPKPVELLVKESKVKVINKRQNIKDLI